VATEHPFGPSSERASYTISRDSIAHRGLHDIDAGVPENSLPACEAAIAAGYPIELDVRLTSDSVVVVFHDRHLGRLVDGVEEVIATPWSAIRGLDLCGTSQRVPRFDELLNVVAGRVPLLVELKHRGDVGPLERAVWGHLAAYDGPFAVQSFDPFSMKWFADNAPHVPRGQLSGDFRDESDLATWKKWILRNLLLTGRSLPQFVGYDIRCVPQWNLSRLRRRGVAVLGWTVRTPDEAELAAPYVDNIIFEGFRP